MNSYLITDFQHVIPDNVIPQPQTLSWIAHMHKLAEAQVKNMSHEDLDIFHEEIHNNLSKIGLGKEKISQRGIHLKDLLKKHPSEMDVYDIYKYPHGSGLKVKMDLFSKEMELVMERLYQDTPLPSHLIHVTCTGYVSPSPAQKLVSKKGASKTYVTHAYHMGCYGSLPALRIASSNSLSGNDCDIVHTEFCTLHMNPLSHSLGQLVVESLFADGFIKYSVVTGSDAPGFAILALSEIIIPDSEHCMKWQCEDWGFGMILAKDVPVKIARALEGYLKGLAEKANLSHEELLKKAFFAIHPGGPKIINQIQEKLSLSDEQVCHSKEILRLRGNMSSATLPHIWETMLLDANIEKGSYIVSMAFGPGLTISGAIFQKKG